MLKKLLGWWATTRCYAVGHNPDGKLLYCQVTSSGEEYLEGRDCTRCGLESFCYSMADRPEISQVPATHGVVSPNVIVLTPEEAKGYNKRRLAAAGWKIIERSPLEKDADMRRRARAVRASGIARHHPA